MKYVVCAGYLCVVVLVALSAREGRQVRYPAYELAKGD